MRHLGYTLRDGQGYGYSRHFQLCSAILWRSVLLVEETGVPGENHQPVVGH